VEGIRSEEFGFVVDFKKIKGIVRELCSKLDHKILIPLKNDKIEFKNLKESLEFSIGSKRYLLPLEDCCLLPLKSTSAEELAEYFAKNLYKSLKKDEDGISKVKICVNEGIGQGACYIQEAK
jgi:6-pyruvoyltetrahydropterin/6-carboxytetrahydropterin synthase